MKLNEKQTFCMLKPDVLQRNLIGKVLKELEEKHFKIVSMEMKQLSKEAIEEFYKDHKEKFFFADMVSRINSSPVVGLVLEVTAEGKNAITHLRDIMGATNPANAAEGTIRKLYALSIDDNSVHGSDSAENADREAAIFFGK